MKKKYSEIPVFLGLTHIGQIYSISWVKSIGQCAVFDFDKKNLNNFKKRKLTNEERNLSDLQYNSKKIFFYKNLNEIKNHKFIFLTYDTPINNVGYPDIKYIEEKLKKVLSVKFEKKTFIIITSQVYPGFTDYIKTKYLKNNKMVNLVYMVDTLKMGNAVERFLKPEQMIFGIEKSHEKEINNFFQNFKCKKFMKSFKEAELLKISINLYLYFSVNFANVINNFSKQLDINYLNIIENLKRDKRIGFNSYIYPSPGISGGHLERDVFFLKKKNKNLTIKKIFFNFNQFNNSRKNELKNTIINLKKKNIRLLIIGISYKENSFSLINSIFQKIFDSKKIKTSYYDSYFNVKLNNLSLKRVVKLKDELIKSDLILLNYCNKKDFTLIKKEFLELYSNKYLINISNYYTAMLKEYKNVFNFYLDNINKYDK